MKRYKTPLFRACRLQQQLEGGSGFRWLDCRCVLALISAAVILTEPGWCLFFCNCSVEVGPAATWIMVENINSWTQEEQQNAAEYSQRFCCYFRKPSRQIKLRFQSFFLIKLQRSSSELKTISFSTGQWKLTPTSLFCGLFSFWELLPYKSIALKSLQ